jgi:hypothetical protein
MNEQLYFVLVTILQAGRAQGFTDPYNLPQNPVPPIPEIDLGTSYSRHAIVGADAAASNGVPLKEVFQAIVATTRDRTPTRMSSILVTFENLWIDQRLQSVLCGPLGKQTFLPCLVINMAE